MQHTEETKEMAQKVLDFITFNPHIHSQENWSFTAGEKPVVSEDKNVCNTTMCIAGTVQFMDKGIRGLGLFESDEAYAEDEAGSLLGLDYDEANTLFYTFNNNKAVEMLRAVAEGDEDKFWHIYNAPEKSENAEW